MFDTYGVLIFSLGLIASLIAYIYVKDMNRLNTAIAQLSKTLGDIQMLLMEEGFVTSARCDKKCTALTKRLDSVEHDLIAGGNSSWNSRKRGE